MNTWDDEHDPTITIFNASSNLCGQITDSLGDFADEHDIDAIYHELIAHEGEDGKIILDADEYWEIVKRHAND